MEAEKAVRLKGSSEQADILNVLEGRVRTAAHPHKMPKHVQKGSLEDLGFRFMLHYHQAAKRDEATLHSSISGRARYD